MFMYIYMYVGAEHINTYIFDLLLIADESRIMDVLR